jgi:dolichol kinase
VSGPALRRVLHATTTALVLLPGFLGWPAFRFIVTALFALAALLEAARLRVPAAGRRIAAIVPVYRPTEATRVSGGFWLAAGYVVAVWLPATSPAPAIAGIAVAALGDPAASLVGAALRRPPGKSWAGSGAVLAIAGGVLFAVGQPVRIVIAGALTAAAVERWSGALDDNLLLAPAVTLLVIALA